MISLPFALPGLCMSKGRVVTLPEEHKAGPRMSLNVANVSRRGSWLSSLPAGSPVCPVEPTGLHMPLDHAPGSLSGIRKIPAKVKGDS